MYCPFQNRRPGGGKGLSVADIDWTFSGLWPYQPRWFATPAGRMHYIDEGPRDGRPVVLVHGNPSWGFLYRNFIGPLADSGHRVIVPDHLGFGRSDKPGDASVYRIAEHAARLDALLESLDLRGAVVVPQDWGGPIGLSWAVAHPERVSGLFILNTFAHRPPSEIDLPMALKLFRTPGVGEILVQGLAAFHRAFFFRLGVVHRERLTTEIRNAYLAPHPTWSSRVGVLAFPRQIPASPHGEIADFCGAIESELKRVYRGRPVKVVWAMDDIALTPELLEQLWMRTFPDAEVVRLQGAGHYLQEDAHERIVPELLAFLASASVAGAVP
jgi:pimeloyl-ACP methyl ester carboxylesterase